MVVSRKETPPNINMYINDTKLQQRDQFKYLGALISSDGRDTTEISSRIALSKTMFKRMKNILANPHMSIETRKRVLELLHRTYIGVWMRDLDNIKTNARQVRGDGNVVPTKNDENTMDCEKTKRYSFK
ncbi:RNA-directed DNA polymerase from mobile element jockey-like [Elysia marginata]|uniref:RNA-directed DNA polymerase from mobile element jockey-like n=1 Tax=Elysia marginata TaxID=1093978 RepID=A0AAV4GWU3_9GAST|nr:RNA-directed DNA polymerase from mobile element jockey-like [Elysia marginata]